MCGVVGSYDPLTAVDLAKKSAIRGTLGWSLSVIVDFRLEHYEEVKDVFNPADCHNRIMETIGLTKSAGLTSAGNPFYLVHLVSPTNGPIRYHPAASVNINEEYGVLRLWHNGMMDSSMHSKIGDKWDTEYLVESIYREGMTPDFGQLDRFAGSFACVLLIKGCGLYAFRNKISPLFVSRDGNGQIHSIASIKFAGCEKLEDNKVISIPNSREVATFNNTYNPFGV